MKLEEVLADFRNCEKFCDRVPVGIRRKSWDSALWYVKPGPFIDTLYRWVCDEHGKQKLSVETYVINTSSLFANDWVLVFNDNEFC